VHRYWYYIRTKFHCFSGTEYTHISASEVISL